MWKRLTAAVRGSRADLAPNLAILLDPRIVSLILDRPAARAPMWSAMQAFIRVHGDSLHTPAVRPQANAKTIRTSAPRGARWQGLR